MVRNYNDVGINAQMITRMLLNNQNLLKLLYYTDREPLDKEDLDSKQIQEVFEKYIKIVPRIGELEGANPIIALRFASFMPNDENPEFKDIILKIEIITPLDSWIIKNVNLRPFLIMGEIEKSLSGKRVNGLGTIRNIGAELYFLSDEVSNYQMTFVIRAYD